MSNLLEIINSKISDKSKLGEWFTDRLEVCRGCEFNSENKKDLNMTDRIMIAANLGKPTCLGCGCEIAAKASVQTEDCGAVKKGLKSKWKKIDLSSQEGFSVINKNDNVVLNHIKDNYYEINYGKIPFDSDSEIKLLISKKGLVITDVRTSASCGCTGTNAVYSDKNEITFTIKYDTLRVGEFQKSTSLTIRDSDNRVYNIFVNIKGEVDEF